jgi:hypothetical protein
VCSSDLLFVRKGQRSAPIEGRCAAGSAARCMPAECLYERR